MQRYYIICIYVAYVYIICNLAMYSYVYMVSTSFSLSLRTSSTPLK